MITLVTPIHTLENASPGSWWGMQLDFAIGDCTPGLVRDRLVLKRWSRGLVEKIGMTAHGDPRLVHFGEGDLAGWTLLEQLITTSNITAHFNDETNSGLITVFSCKHFNVDDAVRFTVEFFGCGDCYEGTVMDRYIPIRAAW